MWESRSGAASAASDTTGRFGGRRGGSALHEGRRPVIHHRKRPRVSHGKKKKQEKRNKKTIVLLRIQESSIKIWKQTLCR